MREWGVLDEPRSLPCRLERTPGCERHPIQLTAHRPRMGRGHSPEVGPWPHQMRGTRIYWLPLSNSAKDSVFRQVGSERLTSTTYGFPSVPAWAAMTSQTM